ncbi:MAG: alpha/beta hydrolase [Alphaproteobacteria bacterium]|jgi:hypothetical protein|nr:alpha/beta hydrolase [Alphaproteobacteria bacterium]
MNDWIWRGAANAFDSYTTLLGLAFTGQRNLMYFPDVERPDPAAVGVPEMQPVSLETADGLSLLAWYRGPARKNLPTLVYFHGNAGNIGMRAYKARPYLDAGLGILLTTWRGFSRNPGKPNEDGLYADGRAALDFLKNEGTGIEHTVLYGESLGTGVAVHLAAELALPPAAVVLEAPYSSIADVAQARLPFAPIRRLVLDRFDSAAKASDITAPLLIVHGEGDGTVPVRFGRQLLAAAVQPKEGVFLPDAGHNDLYEHGMGSIVLDFLTRQLSQT